jgi:hypothetical protein
LKLQLEQDFQDVERYFVEEVEWLIARFLNLAGSDWLHAQSALQSRA